jgi:hypothetical protein
MIMSVIIRVDLLADNQPLLDILLIPFSTADTQSKQEITGEFYPHAIIMTPYNDNEL